MSKWKAFVVSVFNTFHAEKWVWVKVNMLEADRASSQSNSRFNKKQALKGILIWIQQQKKNCVVDAGEIRSIYSGDTK